MYTNYVYQRRENIDAAQLLSKPVMLTMGGGALRAAGGLQTRPWRGDCLSGVSAVQEDQSTYQITLQPFLPAG